MEYDVMMKEKVEPWLTECVNSVDFPFTGWNQYQRVLCPESGREGFHSDGAWLL